jgi:hypothetical protein
LGHEEDGRERGTGVPCQRELAGKGLFVEPFAEIETLNETTIDDHGKNLSLFSRRPVKHA